MVVVDRVRRASYARVATQGDRGSKQGGRRRAGDGIATLCAQPRYGRDIAQRSLHVRTHAEAEFTRASDGLHVEDLVELTGRHSRRGSEVQAPGPRGSAVMRKGALKRLDRSWKHWGWRDESGAGPSTGGVMLDIRGDAETDLAFVQLELLGGLCGIVTAKVQGLWRGIGLEHVLSGCRTVVAAGQARLGPDGGVGGGGVAKRVVGREVGVMRAESLAGRRRLTAVIVEAVWGGEADTLGERSWIRTGEARWHERSIGFERARLFHCAGSDGRGARRSELVKVAEIVPASCADLRFGDCDMLRQGE